MPITTYELEDEITEDHSSDGKFAAERVFLLRWDERDAFVDEVFRAPVKGKQPKPTHYPNHRNALAQTVTFRPADPDIVGTSKSWPYKMVMTRFGGKVDLALAKVTYIGEKGA